MDILIGLFLVAFGVVIAFMGVQVFFAILPLLGFIAGFYGGAAGMEAAFGDGFLSTVGGWIVGFIVGLLCAAIAWYWWYAGVLLSAGLAGALIATALAEAIGIDSQWILFIFGAVGAAVLVLAAFMLDLPVYLVIANTAIAGGAILVSGLLLLFDRIDTEHLTEGFAYATARESWWWVLVWAVVAAVGITRQLTLKERIRLPSDRWVHAEPARV